MLADNKILFDAGEKGATLLNNIKELDINPDMATEAIVLSHDHGDHAGKLQPILDKMKSRKTAGTG